MLVPVAGGHEIVPETDTFLLLYRAGVLDQLKR